MREEAPASDRTRPVPWLRAWLRRFFPGEKVSDAPVWIWLWALFEALLFCLGALAVSFWVFPGDPFGLKSQFPWLWLVPALLALRYGSVIGMAAVGVLFASWLAMEELGLVEAVFPQAYFLGGLVLVLLCGQFGDVWNSRQRRLRAVNAYLDERLNTLTKSHFLLRLSHERLEQDLLAKPLTLRETLVRLRGLSARERPREALPGAVEFLQLLAQSCQLEIAAIFTRRPDGGFDPEPAARLGTAVQLDVTDALLAYGLEQDDLVHVQMAEPGMRDFDHGKYLVCAPMVTSSGTRLGLVTVERLPFFALNYDTLQLFTVLLGYYADGVEAAYETRRVLQKVSGCPPDFALDLVRLTRIRETADIQSALVALVFADNERGNAMFALVRRLRRNMDLGWDLHAPGRMVQISLLPLAGAAAVEGYMVRIEGVILAQFGAGFVDAGIAAHTVHLGARAPEDALADLVARCHA